jgi:hypothetical protein
VALGAAPLDDAAPLPVLPAPALVDRLSLTRPALRQEEEYPPYGAEQDEEHQKRFFLSAWAGEGLEDGGSGRSASMLGGELAIAFSSLDLGIATYGYRSLSEATREWTPVAMLRLTQRFPTGRGVEATFGFGAGAGRPSNRWVAWFQVALGIRVPLGPIFLGGELSFEQYSLLRLAAGLGLAF